jgi:uncharacterized protein
MKYLLLLAVLTVAVLWWSVGRRGSRGAPPPGAAPGARTDGTERSGRHPAAMVACAHCGVHLPQPEALFDAAGRPFCSEAHRLAGPR